MKLNNKKNSKSNRLNKEPQLKHINPSYFSFSEKDKLHNLFKDRHVNHIYFYEKSLNHISVNKLRDKLNLYSQNYQGFTLNNNYNIKSNINPIVLHIHCPGGDIDSGLTAMKLIHHSNIPIITIIDGLAASAATYMCMVSNLRLIYPNAYMLIHQPSDILMTKGKFSTIEDKYFRIKQYMITLKKIYKKYTSLNSKQLSTLLAKDIYIDASTCIKYNLVDIII